MSVSASIALSKSKAWVRDASAYQPVKVLFSASGVQDVTLEPLSIFSSLRSLLPWYQLTVTLFASSEVAGSFELPGEHAAMQPKESTSTIMNAIADKNFFIFLLLCLFFAFALLFWGGSDIVPDYSLLYIIQLTLGKVKRFCEFFCDFFEKFRTHNFQTFSA